MVYKWNIYFLIKRSLNIFAIIMMYIGLLNIASNEVHHGLFIFNIILVSIFSIAWMIYLSNKFIVIENDGLWIRSGRIQSLVGMYRFNVIEEMTLDIKRGIMSIKSDNDKKPIEYKIIFLKKYISTMASYAFRYNFKFTVIQ